jgi:CubicO group peptidase (beta-lactamase class C family)
MPGMKPATWVLLVVIVVAGCAVTGDTPRTGQPPARPLDGLRLLPPVPVQDDAGYSLDERMRHHRVEAVSVAVVREFRVAWSDARGLADREAGERATTETLFQAASISKPVTAAAVMRKAQTGELSLDRDVNDYLRSWQLPGNELTAKRKVSLELILSHGAGLTIHGFPGYAVGESVPTVPQVLDGAAPANTAAVRVDVEPGLRSIYSGGGYTIAQLVMTDRFGTPFPELMRALVLEPAGMADSTFAQPVPPVQHAAAGYRADGAPVPGKRHTYPEMAAAGLWTTAGDLARFAIAVQRSLRGDAGSLLEKETAARMVTPFTGEFGLGLHVEWHGGEVYFGHNGANEGFQAVLLAHRDKGYGVAVMTNSDNGVALAMEIVRGVARVEGWEGYLPPPPRVVPLSPQDLAPVVGRYGINGDEAVAVELQGDRLAASLPRVGKVELLPISRDSFVCRETALTLELERDGDRVVGLALTADGEGIKAHRLAPETVLPSDHLAAGRIAEAIAEYRALHVRQPDDSGIAERRLNDFGYEVAGRTEYAKAIAILELNTEFYPASANTFDSLGEILLRSGDRERALAAYRRVLEVLPSDAAASADLKEQLGSNARAKIAELAR